MKTKLFITLIILLFSFEIFYALAAPLKLNKQVLQHSALKKIEPTLLKEMEKNLGKNVKVIVWTRKNLTEQELKVVEDTGKLKHQYNIIPAISMELKISELNRLAEHDFVEKIEPVHTFQIFLQDSTVLINATKVWTALGGSDNAGKNIGICILDTGVNYTHPDLGGCFGSGCKVVGGYDFINNDNNPMDDHGHGTHVAGIAAANGNIKGVAPGANIIAIKVLDSYGYGTDIELIAGIEWCINNAKTYNISVISMSLGTNTNYTSYCDENFPTIASAIDSAIANNISVVAATGNFGNTTAIAAPACIKNVTAVGWSTKTDTIATGSNRNNITDLVAPGTDINSTELSGGYYSYSGTSMSTPHVAGVVALLYQKYILSYNTTPTPNYLEEILNETGIKINDTGGNKLNYSRIDVYAASLRINDTESPKWFGNLSSIHSGSNYTENQNYQFNITWKDNIALDKVIFESNFSGTPTNYTTLSTPSVQNLGNEYYIIFTQEQFKGVFSYRYRWIANDTANNWNSTDVFEYNINKGPIDLNLTLNSTNYNRNYTYPQAINVTGWITSNIYDFNISLYRNDSIVASSVTGKFVNQNIRLGSGTYNYTLVFNGSANYTETAITRFAVINKGNSSANIGLTIDGNLNFTQSRVYMNITMVNASTNIDELDVEYTLLRNGNVVSTGPKANETVQLGAGVYNYTFNASEGANWTAGQKEINLIINPAATSVSIWLNDTKNNKTFDKGALINITAQLNASLSIAISTNFTGQQLDVNTGIGTVTNITNTSSLNLGRYNLTAYYNGSNINYTASSQTYFITLRQSYINTSINIIANETVVINDTSTNVTLGILVNTSLNASVNISLYVDNPTNETIRIIGLNKYIGIEVDGNTTNNTQWYWLNVTYLDTEIIEGVAEDSLKIWYFNSSNSSWIQEPNSGVDITQNYVWANMTHFSNFTIGGLYEDGHTCSIGSDCYGSYCCSGICQSSPCPSPKPSGGISTGPIGGTSLTTTTTTTTITTTQPMTITTTTTTLPLTTTTTIPSTVISKEDLRYLIIVIVLLIIFGIILFLIWKVHLKKPKISKRRNK